MGALFREDFEKGVTMMKSPNTETKHRCRWRSMPNLK